MRAGPARRGEGRCACAARSPGPGRTATARLYPVVAASRCVREPPTAFVVDRWTGPGPVVAAPAAPPPARGARFVFGVTSSLSECSRRVIT
eukprot:3457154-Prymnesium_polylepis.1